MIWLSTPYKQRGSVSVMPVTSAAQQGTGVVCTAGSSAIPNLDSFEDSPTDAWVGAAWRTDGDVFYYENSTASNFPGVSNGGTWQGDCAVSEYDGRWRLTSGDAPDIATPADGVWVQMSVGKVEIEMHATGSNETNIGTMIFELRRRSDQVIILTDVFIMDVETTSGK